MYRLPKDVDFSFLVGATLGQVCIGANEVIFNFDRDIVLAVESEFLIRTPRGETLFREAISSGGAVALLVSSSVSEVSPSTDGTLRLVFGEDAVLEIYDSSREYESYQLRWGDALFVV